MNDEKFFGHKIETEGQYSLAKILVIWALAAIPMGILGWIISPILAPDVNSDPLAAAVIRLMLLTVGLIWLFALTMKEGGAEQIPRHLVPLVHFSSMVNSVLSQICKLLICRFFLFENRSEQFCCFRHAEC